MWFGRLGEDRKSALCNITHIRRQGINGQGAKITQCDRNHGRKLDSTRTLKAKLHVIGFGAKDSRQPRQLVIADLNTWVSAWFDARYKFLYDQCLETMSYHTDSEILFHANVVNQNWAGKSNEDVGREKC